MKCLDFRYCDAREDQTHCVYCCGCGHTGASTDGLVRARTEYAQAWVTGSQQSMEATEFTTDFLAKQAALLSRYRKALEDIAGRWEAPSAHQDNHDPKTCEVVICVAQRALLPDGSRDT
jgi:hypothetical protein